MKACDGADPRLFDSTDWRDHLTARRFCGNCPMVAACAQLAATIAAEHSPDHIAHRGPDGTWAGLLWRNGDVVLPARVGEVAA